MSIKKSINNILKSIIVVFTVFALSGCVSDIETIEDETIEQRMDDLAKRAVLSLFGEVALQAFDVESNVIYDSVGKLPSEDKVSLTAPFSPIIYVILFYFLMLAVTNIVFLTTGIYQVYLTFFNLYSTAKTGDFMGKNVNALFYVLKTFLVFFLLAVTAPPYNTAQVLFIKAMGHSNVIVNKINSALISNQPRTFPSFKMPAADSKNLVSLNLIQFLSCIKSDPNVKASNVILDFYKEGGLVKAKSSYSKCHVEFTLGLDTSTIKVINESEEISKLLGVDVDFEKIQLQLSEIIVKKLLDKADNAADVMLFEIDTVRKKPELFNEYLVKSNSNSTLIENWELGCDNLLSYIPPKAMIETEKEQYQYLASRCLSHEIIKSLVYPSEINNFSHYLRTENYLKNNNIQLCGHDYNNVRMNDKTIISETVASSNDMTTTSIKDCLINACSTLKSEQSNIFMCANAISLYDKSTRNLSMERNGFMAAGAYIYTLFTNSSVSEASKNLVNNFDIKFSHSGVNIDTPSKDAIVFSINHPFTQKLMTKTEYELFEIDPVVFREHEITFSNVEKASPSVINTSLTGFDILGSDRFITCGIHPMQIYNGYSCASIAEETHTFGRNLFNYTIYVKTMITSFRMVNGFTSGTKKVIQYKNKKKPKIDKSLQTTGEKFSSSFRSMINRFVPAAIGYSGAFFLVENNFGGTKIKTDEFGDLTNEKYQSLMNDPNLIMTNVGAFLLAASDDTVVAQYINLFVNIIMVIGLFFGYVIPLFTPFIWLVAVIGLMTTFTSTLIILPVWIPSILKTGLSHSNELMQRGTKILLTAVIKAPFQLIGLIMAWVFVNFLTGRLMSLLNIADALNTSANLDFNNVCTAILILIFYAVIYYVLVMKMLTLIEEFEESSSAAIIGDINEISLSNDRFQGVYKKTKNANKFLK